ncbi:MAG: thymidylate kinase [Halioglobus sp.]|jgi:thymidylate kinase
MNAPENSTLPPLFAIVGCDGSGKSTVSEALLAWIKAYGPAASAHLGKQQGNMSRSIGSWPIIGGVVGRFIEKKASTVRKSRTEKKAPTALPGLVMHAFTQRRVRRFRRMLVLREQGYIILADRFPQLDIRSAFDGPDMEPDSTGSGFVQALARREQTAFEWMTSYQPNLVIRLNVDLDTACARKLDHPRATLERKIGYASLLTFGGANIVEIDANMPLEQVVAAAKAAIEKTFDGLGYERPAT